MKLTKDERKARRKRIMGKIGKGIGAVAGFGVAAGADLIPVPGVSAALKKIPIVRDSPQVKLDDAPLENTVLNDVVPLIRTIKALKKIIERLLSRFL